MTGFDAASPDAFVVPVAEAPESDDEPDLQTAARAEVLGLRSRFNLTQQQLAERLGVHRTTIGSWEAGGSIDNPNLVLLAIHHLEDRAFSDADRHPAIPTPGHLLPTPPPLAANTVPGRLREALGYLRETAELLERLEGSGTSSIPSMPLGLMGLAEEICISAANTLGRLHTIFGTEDDPSIPVIRGGTVEPLGRMRS